MRKSTIYTLAILCTLTQSASVFAAYQNTYNLPSTTPIVTPSFDSFSTGYSQNSEDLNGSISFNNDGVTTQSHTSTVRVNQVATGPLTGPSFGLSIDSLRNGFKAFGQLIGLYVRVNRQGDYNPRVAVMGQVTAPDSNGTLQTAKGYAGYFKNLFATPVSLPEGGVDPGATYSAGNDFKDFIRIKGGSPYAFYTDNDSKFVDDLIVGGNITSNGIVTIDRPTVNGDITVSGVSEASSITVSSPVVRKYYGRAAFDGTGIQTNETFSAEVTCPEDTIRVGCVGGIPNSTTPLYSSYMGAQFYGVASCRSYARKPAATATGNLYVYAYCLESQ